MTRKAFEAALRKAGAKPYAKGRASMILGRYWMFEGINALIPEVNGGKTRREVLARMLSARDRHSDTKKENGK